MKNKLIVIINGVHKKLKIHTCIFGRQVHHLLFFLATHSGTQGTCKRTAHKTIAIYASNATPVSAVMWVTCNQ